MYTVEVCLSWKQKMTMRESQRIEDPIMDEPWCCYHNKEGELSWSGLTCKVWCKYNLVMLSTRVLLWGAGIVTAIFLGAYVVLALFMAGLLAAHVEGGLTVLWAYFAAFVAFVLVLIVVVILGECQTLILLLLKSSIILRHYVRPPCKCC